MEVFPKRGYRRSECFLELVQYARRHKLGASVSVASTRNRDREFSNLAIIIHCRAVSLAQFSSLDSTLLPFFLEAFGSPCEIFNEQR